VSTATATDSFSSALVEVCEGVETWKPLQLSYGEY
ncbi:hypothetical protein F444_23016, partial [Phytophthora nicotianae P1976]